ncbi:hypothetical protein CPC08DRAFT_713041 [Agrocybe pediades]|nr:hypothetical protein CPC08DRAFT_713041 [Agrocybe pediades]
MVLGVCKPASLARPGQIQFGRWLLFTLFELFELCVPPSSLSSSPAVWPSAYHPVRRRLKQSDSRSVLCCFRVWE